MSSLVDTGRAPIRIVLGDANVLYSRVLRDYLLYAADAEVISIRWSAAILAEVVEHLTANLPAFDAAAGRRLVTAMTIAFPDAEVDVHDAARERVAPLPLPDEDDRHVLAAAVAAEAEILCTDNIKDFPDDALERVDIQALTADDLLSPRLRVRRRDACSASHGRFDPSRRNPRVDARQAPACGRKQNRRPHRESRSDRAVLTPGKGRWARNEAHSAVPGCAG